MPPRQTPIRSFWKRTYIKAVAVACPLPVIDAIATEPRPQQWNAVPIENEFLQLMVLPEIGGRIHVGLDKRTAYDFFCRQNVIKPALVDLAGPWISENAVFRALLQLSVTSELRNSRPAEP